jgi:hypothetical protein
MPPVNLAFTSDLHLPITPATVIADMVREIDAHCPDVLAVLGDIGESLEDITKCLAMVKGLVHCPVLVVAGNHDLWIRDYRKKTKQRWRDYLPEVVQAAGCTWLEGEAHVVNGIALAGSIAWYDYSAADPVLKDVSAGTFAQNKRYYNMDAEMIDWPYTDPEFADLVGSQLLATLDRLEADPAIRQTVVFTHVPLLECQMCRRPGNRDWGFSNAYFGNLTLGTQVLQRKKVTHIISGHTHVGREEQVQLADGRTVAAHVLDSQYGRPVWLRITLEVGDG